MTDSIESACGSVTRDEAKALWEQQYDRHRLSARSITLGVRAREYEGEAEEREKTAVAYRVEAKRCFEKAAASNAEALAIPILTPEQMGQLWAYADGRADTWELTSR